MRLALLLCALATPLSAWEFRPDPICTLTHQSGAAEVTVTFDAALPEYAISITLTGGVWPDAALFQITFNGARSFTIQTTAHILSDGGATLTVRDRGFGNVLDGLEFYASALAEVQGLSVPIDLTGAAPEVALFRDCPAPTLS